MLDSNPGTQTNLYKILTHDQFPRHLSTKEEEYINHQRYGFLFEFCSVFGVIPISLYLIATRRIMKKDPISSTRGHYRWFLVKFLPMLLAVGNMNAFAYSYYLRFMVQFDGENKLNFVHRRNLDALERGEDVTF